MNEIRLKAYGFSMEAVGSKKFIAQEREACEIRSRSRQF